MTARQHARRLRRLAGVTAFILAAPAHAQSAVAGSGFQPGGRQLVLLDFSTFPLGAISSTDLTRTGMYDLRGQLEVVMKDGVHMLRAAEPSTFRVRIPEVLPNDFTLEFDLIPKNCCNSPQDLSVEGTSEIRQDAVSAHLLWRPTALQVIGGVVNQSYDKPMPAELSAVLAGSLANIAVSLQGRTLRMFTNGQELYALERAFARGRVLRVFLGGQLRDRNEPVYLARLRIAAGAPAPITVAVPATPGAATGMVNPGSASSPGNTATTARSTKLSARTVTMPGFTAVGTLIGLSPRSVVLPGFTATGAFGALNARTVVIPGFAAAGMFGGLNQRTVAVPGFTATGVFSTLAARTVALPGFSAVGTFGKLGPRNVTVSGFTAVGLFSTLAPRRMSLTGFTAFSGFGMLAPRVVALPGFSAAGSFITLPSRTITLPGFTATGRPDTP